MKKICVAIAGFELGILAARGIKRTVQSSTRENTATQPLSGRRNQCDCMPATESLLTATEEMKMMNKGKKVKERVTLKVTARPTSLRNFKS